MDAHSLDAALHPPPLPHCWHTGCPAIWPPRPHSPRCCSHSHTETREWPRVCTAEAVHRTRWTPGRARLRVLSGTPPPLSIADQVCPHSHTRREHEGGRHTTHTEHTPSHLHLPCLSLPAVPPRVGSACALWGGGRERLHQVRAMRCVHASISVRRSSPSTLAFFSPRCTCCTLTPIPRCWINHHPAVVCL